jgi:hypothetical protein
MCLWNNTKANQARCQKRQQMEENAMDVGRPNTAMDPLRVVTMEENGSIKNHIDLHGFIDKFLRNDFQLFD